jgi:hypothetical protein
LEVAGRRTLRSSPKSLHHGGKEDTEVLLHMLHDEITSRVLTAAMKVHTALGAGCLESTCDSCLRYQLAKDGIVFEHQMRRSGGGVSDFM